MKALDVTRYKVYIVTFNGIYWSSSLKWYLFSLLIYLMSVIKCYNNNNKYILWVSEWKATIIIPNSIKGTLWCITVLIVLYLINRESTLVLNQGEDKLCYQYFYIAGVTHCATPSNVTPQLGSRASVPEPSWRYTSTWQQSLLLLSYQLNLVTELLVVKSLS